MIVIIYDLLLVGRIGLLEIIRYFSLGEVVDQAEGKKDDEKQLMRVISWYLYLYHLRRWLPYVLHQVFLNTVPPDLIIHRLNEVRQLSVLEPQHPHNAVYQSRTIPSLVEDTLVDQAGDLTQVNRVVELVVDDEERGKGLYALSVSGSCFRPLAKHNWRVIFLPALLY